MAPVLNEDKPTAVLEILAVLGAILDTVLGADCAENLVLLLFPYFGPHSLKNGQNISFRLSRYDFCHADAILKVQCGHYDQKRFEISNLLQ